MFRSLLVSIIKSRKQSLATAINKATNSNDQKGLSKGLQSFRKAHGHDIINLQNFLIAYSSLKGLLPQSLQGKMSFREHPYQTRIMDCLQLSRPPSRTIFYGSRSINARAIEIWNSINKTHSEQKFLDKSHAICKNFIIDLLLAKY